MARKIRAFVEEAEDGDLYTTEDLARNLGYASPISIRNGVGSISGGVLQELRTIYADENGKKTYWGNLATIAALKEKADARKEINIEEDED